MDDRDIFLIEVSRRGRDGDYAGASEVAALKTRATALEARPVTDHLDDLVPGATDGQVPAKQSDGGWAPVTPSSGVKIGSSSSTVSDGAQTLDFSGSFNLDEPSAGYVTVFPKFGGSGSSGTFSRSDHNHTNPVPVRQTFGPQAYMSSGTRTLGSTSVVLPNGVNCVVKARLNLQMRGSDPGQCQYQLRLTIDGDARTSNGGASGFWCVQGVPDKTTWEHHLLLPGAGTAITVTAECIYYGGGGFNTDAGEIVVEVSASR